MKTEAFKRFVMISAAVPLLVAGCDDILDPNEPGNLVPMTVLEDPALPSIPVNGTRLHAESFGDIQDPILIFLHGGPGSDYRALISSKGGENASRYPNLRTQHDEGLSQLREQFFCVFFDQRGAGLSPRFDKGVVGFETYLQDLDAVISYFLEKKRIETGVLETQVSLVGWSFGAILSTGYINRYPHRVKDVVFYEPGPFSPEAWDYVAENTTSVFGQIGEGWLAEYLLSHDHISPDAHERADYQMLLGAFRAPPEFHQDPNTPLWRLGAFIGDENLDFQESNDFDITSNLSAFGGRLLILTGELTEAELPAFTSMQRQHYPRSEHAVVPGVGHTGPWEKPDEIAERIRQFLGQ